MSAIDPNQARQFATAVVRKLREAGFEAYWAGGCVRDQLLGRQPIDYDVATNATPQQIRHLFGYRRTLAIGAAFGVITVLGPKSAGQVEVATFRRDEQYSDGRHPDRVEFTSAVEDAQRRDFTINGLFYDPADGSVIDYVGGVPDLQARRVRAIGDPRARFTEDKLRMLRAIRFAVTFDFTLDEATRAAIGQQAGELVVVSAERIAAELRRMLEHPGRARAVELLHQCRLLEVILPEAGVLQPGSGGPEGAWQRTLRVLRRLDRPRFPVALAALLREICGPAESDGQPAEPICRRWKLSNEETSAVGWLLQHEPLVRRARRLAWPQLQRILICQRIDDLLTLAEAVAQVVDGTTADVAYCRQKRKLPAQQLDPPPLITGNDLKQLGIPAGPIYKRLLDAVREAQLEQRLTTAQQARQLARQIYDQGPVKK